MPAQAHFWNIPAIGVDNVGISRFTPPFANEETRVSIVLIPGLDAPRPIVSTLTVTASLQLSGVNVTCSDSQSDANQITRATVFGKFLHIIIKYLSHNGIRH